MELSDNLLVAGRLNLKGKIVAENGLLAASNAAEETATELTPTKRNAPAEGSGQQRQLWQPEQRNFHS